MDYKIIKKDDEVFFKYMPIKAFKKTDKKTLKENPFGVLKKLKF